MAASSVPSPSALTIWPEAVLTAEHSGQCSGFGVHRGLSHQVLVGIKAHKKTNKLNNKTTAEQWPFFAGILPPAAEGDSAVLASRAALPEFFINCSSAIKSHSDCASLTIRAPKILAALRQ